MHKKNIGIIIVSIIKLSFYLHNYRCNNNNNNNHFFCLVFHSFYFNFFLTTSIGYWSIYRMEIKNNYGIWEYVVFMKWIN